MSALRLILAQGLGMALLLALLLAACGRSERPRQTASRPAAVPAPDPSGVTDAAPGGSGQRRVPSGFTSTHSPRSAEM